MAPGLSSIPSVRDYVWCYHHTEQAWVWSPRQLRCQSDPVEKLVQRNDCCGRCIFFSSALAEVWCFSASSRLVRLNRFSTEHFGCCNYDCPSLIHISSGRKTCNTADDRSHKTSRELDPPRLLLFSSSSPRTSTSTRSEFPLFANSSPDNVFQVSESHFPCLKQHGGRLTSQTKGILKTFPCKSIALKATSRVAHTFNILPHADRRSSPRHHHGSACKRTKVA